MKKLGVRTCPHCGGIISSAECREETEKKWEMIFMSICTAAGAAGEWIKFTRTFFLLSIQRRRMPGM